jgi:RNA polymerase sigma-70 factor (ECF subfamily)
MEPASFHQIYEAYAKDVFRYTLSLSGNEAEAEEITAAAFFRAWTGEPLRDGTAKAYLLTIARNLFFDERRRAKRQAPLEEAAEVEARDAGADLRAELKRTVAVLNSLPAEYRDPLSLWSGGGLSYEEIAVQLGLSVSVVKVRIHRARLKLAERLAGQKTPTGGSR